MRECTSHTSLIRNIMTLREPKNILSCSQTSFLDSPPILGIVRKYQRLVCIRMATSLLERNAITSGVTLLPGLDVAHMYCL